MIYVLLKSTYYQADEQDSGYSSHTHKLLKLTDIHFSYCGCFCNSCIPMIANIN